jgi:hypothetical protein
MQRRSWRLVTIANLNLCARFLQAWKASDRLLAILGEASISGACLRHGDFEQVGSSVKCGALLARNHQSQDVGRSESRSRSSLRHLDHMPITANDVTIE